MKKRLLSIFLALAMLLCFMPTISFAEESHTHHICGDKSCTITTHGALEWTGISALSEITVDGLYYLKNDVNLSDAWTCTYEVDLCLGGKTITGADGTAVIKVSSGAYLTITDCGTSGKITHKTGESGCGIESNGCLTIWNGTISGNSIVGKGGGVYVGGRGSFFMEGGSITGNIANSGGGVYCKSASGLVMRGGSISGNTADYGGGLYCAGSISSSIGDGSSISGNIAKKDGGGIYCAGSKFYMKGGNVSGNTADYGGGIYVCKGKNFTMSGGTIENCTANGNGGAIYGVSGSTVTIKKGTLKNCRTNGYYGGGVYISSGATFEMHNDAMIDNCVAERTSGSKHNEGGGVYNAGTFVMDGGTIQNCTAVSSESRGGGVYVATGSTFTMSGGLITGNKASTGGGVGLWGGTFTMSGGTVKNNTATGSGNEISMLYGSANIDFNMTGGSVIHDQENGGSSQIHVSGDNSSMKVSGSAQIDVCGSNYGFSGNGSVQIESGYVKAVGKVSAYEYKPTVGEVIAAAGNIGAEKILDRITDEDYQKQAVIVATGKGNIFKVQYSHPSFVTTEAPATIQLIRGMHIPNQPIVENQGDKYFGGWKKPDGNLWTVNDTVTSDITLVSNWNTYSVDIRRQDNNQSVTAVSLTLPYGYQQRDGNQSTLICNYDAPITVSFENDSDVIDVQGIFDSASLDLVYNASIGTYDKRGFYFGIKGGLSAGTHYDELVLNITGVGGYYQSKKIIPVTVVIEKATPNKVTAPGVQDISYGKSLKQVALKGGSVMNLKYLNGQVVGYDKVEGTFSWAEPDKICAVGDNQSVDVIFTPEDTTNYNIVKLQVSVNVKRATKTDIPELQTFNEITYGETLGDIELTDGWKWVDASVKPEVGGSYEAYFTIDDENNYDLTGITDYANGKITRFVAVNVTKAVPTVTQWPTAQDISEGDCLSESALSGGTADVPGKFVWAKPNTVAELGTKEYEVTFTPTDTKNYESVSEMVSVAAEDTMSPQIDGVSNGAIYCEAKTVTVSDRHLASVTVNGKTVIPDESGCFVVRPAKGKQTISAEDTSGNVFSLTVTVNDGHTWGAWSCDGTNHTRICAVSGCGATDTGVCSGGTATCIKKAACDICGSEYGELGKHDFKTEWSFDNTEHWHKCTLCGEKRDKEVHTYRWKSQDGQYWQRCEICGNETDKKDIPEIAISGAERVCRTQDYSFNFTLPEGYTLVSVGYAFEKLGGELTATPENGIYTASLAASDYPEDADSFKVTLNVKTTDGLPISSEKTVTIQNDHSGGKATCKDKAVCEVCNESYGETEPTNHSNLKHIEAVEATILADGNKEYWYCDGCDKYYSDENATNEIKKEDTVIAKRVPVNTRTAPVITAGDGATVTQGERKELSFTSNAAFSDFIRVEVDGVTLDEKNYTKKEGSTIITLKADYVATLSAGEHTLSIVSTNGTATAKFTVNQKAEDVTDEDDEDDIGEDDTDDTDDEELADSTKSADTKSPLTGNYSTAVWTGFVFILIGVGVVIIFKRKRRISN